MRVGVMMGAVRQVAAEMEHLMVDWDRCWLQTPDLVEGFALDWARNHMNHLLLHSEVPPKEEAVEPPDLVVTREDVPFRLAAVVVEQVEHNLLVLVDTEVAAVVEDMGVALRQLLVDNLAVQVEEFEVESLDHNSVRNLEHRNRIPLGDQVVHWHFVEDTVLAEPGLQLEVRTSVEVVVIVDLEEVEGTNQALDLDVVMNSDTDDSVVADHLPTMLAAYQHDGSLDC